MKIGGSAIASARNTTYPVYAAKRLDRSSPKLRVRFDVRATLHIQHRRPNGSGDRGTKWNKHPLGQWAEVMGVGDRKCALMRAQTCTQHHTSSIGGQRAGPIEPQIDTKTHWGTRHKLWGSVCSKRAHSAHNAQSGRHSRPKRARSARTSVKRENEHEAREYRHGTAPRSRSASVWRALRIARSAVQKKDNLIQTQVLERVIRRRRILLQTPD
jgi:hypothetical protein